MQYLIYACSPIKMLLTSTDSKCATTVPHTFISLLKYFFDFINLVKILQRLEALMHYLKSSDLQFSPKFNFEDFHDKGVHVLENTRRAHSCYFEDLKPTIFFISLIDNSNVSSGERKTFQFC